MSDAQKLHLVFIIHGVGRHDLDKQTRYLNGIKSNMAKLIAKRKISSEQRIEFVFTEWHSTLKEFRDTVVNDLTVPKGFQLLKMAMSDILSDALFYSERTHRDRIVSAVVDQINEIVAKFTQENPNHDIQASCPPSSMPGFCTVLRQVRSGPPAWSFAWQCDRLRYPILAGKFLADSAQIRGRTSVESSHSPSGYRRRHRLSIKGREHRISKHSTITGPTMQRLQPIHLRLAAGAVPDHPRFFQAVRACMHVGIAMRDFFALQPN
jgi:hypothetical protein